MFFVPLYMKKSKTLTKKQAKLVLDTIKQIDKDNALIKQSEESHEIFQHFNGFKNF